MNVVNKVTPNDKYVYAERGMIYRWRESGHYALVVSSDRRAQDHLVSVLILSTFRNTGGDVVPVEFDGKQMCVHTDLVTYTSRAYLHEAVEKLPDELMERIDLGLMNGLSLSSDTEMYKKMYYELLEKVTRKN